MSFDQIEKNKSDKLIHNRIRSVGNNSIRSIFYFSNTLNRFLLNYLEATEMIIIVQKVFNETDKGLIYLNATPQRYFMKKAF